MKKRIIVGYDGSSYSRAALMWAMDEAAHTDATVELVHADERPVVASPHPESTLERAVATARKAQPLVEVTARTVDAYAVPTLVDLSRQADLIVIGGRGHSIVAGLLGSVSTAVSAHARCPVVVVRGEATAGPVVAGVDGTDRAPEVLAFAAAQAAARKAPLRVIRAWPPVTGLWEETPIVTNAVTGREREPFDTLIAETGDAYPDVSIVAEATVAHPAAVLTLASAHAQLLVIGSRGHGPFSGLLLGSVSQHLLRNASCTVAVVHHRGSSGPTR